MGQEETKIPQIKVQEASPNCPLPPPCPVVPKPKPGPAILRIFLVFILALVLALVILAASGLRIVRKESLLDIWLSSRKPTPIPTLVPEPTPTPDPTASWKLYSNNSLSFKYPATWTESGYVITSNAPLIKLVVVPKDSTLMNECMQETATETKEGFTIKKFSRVSAGAMCAASDTTPREIWIMPSAKIYSPGISYEYSFTDSVQAESIFDQILSTFKFTTVTPISSPSAQTKGGLAQGTPIKIKSISLATATGPLVIKGTVDPGWMFEGVMPVLLLDSSRNEIATGSAVETTLGSWQTGNSVSFSVSLTFTTEDDSGFLVFQNDNPSDLPENAKSFEIPVKFKQK